MEQTRTKKVFTRSKSYTSPHQQKNRKKGFANQNANKNNSRNTGRNDQNANLNGVLITPNRAKKIISKRRTIFPDGSLPDISRPQTQATEQEPTQEIAQGAEQTGTLDIYTDIFDDKNQTVISFDAAIEQIKKNESLEEDETIIYGGRGVFFVLGLEQEGRKSTQIVRRKIEFEQKNKDNHWREKLRFGLSMSYKPNPAPMTELYTAEDIAKFKLHK